MLPSSPTYFHRRSWHSVGFLRMGEDRSRADSKDQRRLANTAMLSLTATQRNAPGSFARILRSASDMVGSDNTRHIYRTVWRLELAVSWRENFKLEMNFSRVGPHTGGTHCITTWRPPNPALQGIVKIALPRLGDSLFPLLARGFHRCVWRSDLIG